MGSTFKGRTRDLDRIAGQLELVSSGRASTHGKALILTGRRRVGKSRLVQEFCDRSGAPYVIFQATKGRSATSERADLIEAVTQAGFPNSELIGGMVPSDWNQALRTIALALPDDRPSIVVIDEIPWLAEQDTEFEGALQTVWDRQLSAKPVLLVLVGSDLSVMEALQSYGRPFFGRATHMSLRPLDPHDVQVMTELPAAEAIDAYLLTGGFPEIIGAWEAGTPRDDFLRRSLCDPLSPLLVAGELSLLGEFPEATYARGVLEAIGTGERTFGTIANKVGVSAPLSSGTLSPILATLIAKRVVAADLPLSTKPDNKNRRYRVSDEYLRFWLAFLRRGIPEAERGRGDLVVDRIAASWTSWRGRAVEPLIRESLARLLPDSQWPETEAVGGWWNRQNNPEVDLVAADRAPVAARIDFVGSIKWLENQPFGKRDYDQLARDVRMIPGTGPDTPLIAVSRSGVQERLPLTFHWGPEDLIRAWA